MGVEVWGWRCGGGGVRGGGVVVEMWWWRCGGGGVVVKV